MTYSITTTYGDFISAGNCPDVSTLDRFGDHSDEAIIKWFRLSYIDDDRYDHTKITITGTGMDRVVFVPKV